MRQNSGNIALKRQDNSQHHPNLNKVAVVGCSQCSKRTVIFTETPNSDRGGHIGNQECRESMGATQSHWSIRTVPWTQE